MNVSVKTEVWRTNGPMFCDLGVMQWFGVDDEVVQWLAGSCRTTAGWLVALPVCTDPETFAVKYRTIVSRPDGSVKSDTTLLEFEAMSYANVLRFERWALEQLREMVDLFESKRGRFSAPKGKANKPWRAWRLLSQVMRNKWKGYK